MLGSKTQLAIYVFLIVHDHMIIFCCMLHSYWMLNTQLPWAVIPLFVQMGLLVKKSCQNHLMLFFQVNRGL
jgi:hypothetical protein